MHQSPNFLIGLLDKYIVLHSPQQVQGGQKNYKTFTDFLVKQLH